MKNYMILTIVLAALLSGCGTPVAQAASMLVPSPWPTETPTIVPTPTPNMALTALAITQAANDAERQRTQNEARVRPILRYVRPTGGGPFHEWAALLGGDLRVTTDGALRRRSAAAFTAVSGQLRNYYYLECEAEADLPADDVREISQTGIAFGRTGAWSASCNGSSDQSRPLYVEAFGA